MFKPFDATTKALLEGYPESWIAYLGLVPDGPVRIIDTDLATVTAEVDKVFRIDGPEPYLVHLEMQASADATLPRRLWRYNALLDLRHELRVRSIAVLLRPEADTANLIGVLDLRLPEGRRIVEFHYEVVRAWRQAVEPLLAGGLGTLPLAPLANIPHAEVARVIEQIDARLAAEAPKAKAATIMEATLVLAGLRLENDEIKALRGRLHTVNITTESSYYRIAVEEGMEKGLKEGELRGKIEEAQRLIRRLGEARFGAPGEEVRKTIAAIEDIERLEQLSLRLLVVGSWSDMLASPSD